MAMKEFKDLTTEELRVKLTDLKQELFNLRFSHAIGQLTNPLKLNTTKKDIARVQTLIKQRQLKGEGK